MVPFFTSPFQQLISLYPPLSPLSITFSLPLNSFSLFPLCFIMLLLYLAVHWHKFMLCDYFVVWWLLYFIRRGSYPEHSASSRPSNQRVLTDIPVEALSEAMTEVREAMTRYTNCPDPTESAARRERFRQAEEAGEVEETVTLMLIGASTNNIPEGDQELTHQSLSPTSPRVPALLRLGPIMEDEEHPSTPLAMSTANVTKRRPGRPPGRRNITPSPRSFLGIALRRRTISKTQPSPHKRKSSSAIPRRSANSNIQKSTMAPNSSTLPRRSKTVNVARLPSSSTQRDSGMDFRDPSSPLP